MSYRAFIVTLLGLTAIGCSQQDKKPRLPESAVVGVWSSDTLTTPDGAGRSVYRLQMDATGMAEFVSTVVGQPSRAERGTWDGADSLVRVVVRGEGTASRPTSLLLAIRGRTELGLVRYDSTAWGAQGLTLFRRGTDAPSATR